MLRDIKKTMLLQIGFTVSAPYRAEELEDRGFLWENGVGGGKVPK